MDRRAAARRAVDAGPRRHRSFIASFAGDDRFVVDYLVEEVLERQTDEVREFLLETSILTRLDRVAVRRRDRSAAAARQRSRSLDRANLFLVPLDDRRSWYRYHHLFADVLRARWLDEAPERVDELHRRASDWYDAHGEPDEAIAHAMAGQHFERAAQLIELATPMLTRTRQEAALRRWLEALPDDVSRRDRCSASPGRSPHGHGDTTGVEELLDAVGGTARPRPPPRSSSTTRVRQAPAQAAVFRAGLALLSGDIPARSHARRALDARRANDHLGQGAATSLLGLAHWASGDLEAARPMYVEAIPRLVAAGHFADVLGMYSRARRHPGRAGPPRRRDRTFEVGLAHARRHPGCAARPTCTSG